MADEQERKSLLSKLETVIASGSPHPFLIDLSPKQKDDHCFTDLDLSKIISLLKTTKHDFHLNLSHNDISDLTMLNLEPLIESSSKLIKLDISSMNLTQNGFRILSSALSKNKWLEELKLDFSEIDLSTDSKIALMNEVSRHPKLHLIEFGYLSAHAFEYFSQNFEKFGKLRSISLRERSDSIFDERSKKLLIETLREKQLSFPRLESISISFVKEDLDFERFLSSILSEIRKKAEIKLDLELRDQAFMKKPKDLEL